VAAIMDAKYFITNGPIIEHKANGAWPTLRMTPPNGEFMQELTLKAAPWVKPDSVEVDRSGQFMRRFQMEPTANVIRFPYNEDTKAPYLFRFHNTDLKTNKEMYNDGFMTIKVTGRSLAPVVTNLPWGSYTVFAMTPPVLVDANADGKFEIK
jgi:hypothetical protein